MDGREEGGEEEGRGRMEEGGRGGTRNEHEGGRERRGGREEGENLAQSTLHCPATNLPRLLPPSSPFPARRCLAALSNSARWQEAASERSGLLTASSREGHKVSPRPAASQPQPPPPPAAPTSASCPGQRRWRKSWLQRFGEGKSKEGTSAELLLWRSAAQEQRKAASAVGRARKRAKKAHTQAPRGVMSIVSLPAHRRH